MFAVPSEDPAGEPEVRQPDDVVGVKVGQEEAVKPAERDVQLRQPLRHAAPGVEHKEVVVGLDQGARPEAIQA